MTETGKNLTNNDVLADVDEAKRATLSRLIKGTAFVAPIVVSFAMDGLVIPTHAVANSAAPSDRRLKTGVARVATLSSGVGLYRFKYLWDATEYVGVMAQEVQEIVPAAVVEGADGFLRVDYAKLGLEMQTYADWQKRELSRLQQRAA